MPAQGVVARANEQPLQARFDRTFFINSMQRQQSRDGLPHHLVAAVAKEALGGGIPVRHGAIQAQGNDGVHAAAQHGGGL